MTETVLLAALMLGLGALFNLALIIALKLSWRHWTQAKWYVVLLTVGNCVDVLFGHSTQLAVNLTDGWHGGDVSCKSLMFLKVLGSSVANMAVAALSLHVLLTSASGCHGSRLRHAVVLGLFVLLSLPWPASNIPVYNVLKAEDGQAEHDEEISLCADLSFFQEHDPEGHLRFYFYVAGAVASIFFPLVIAVGAYAGTLMLECTESQRSRKTESNTPDIVLAFLLGLVLLLTCIPVTVFILHFHGRMTVGMDNIYLILKTLFAGRATVSALACLPFACVHAYRKGRRQDRYECNTRVDEGKHLMK